MLALRLPPAIEKRLTLAKKTGRTRSFYAREATLRQPEDIEDYYLARRRLARGGSRVTLGNLEPATKEARGALVHDGAGLASRVRSRFCAKLALVADPSGSYYDICANALIGRSARRLGHGLTGNCKRLCRYCVGDYRIVASIEDDHFVVLVVAIGHRREVYRRSVTASTGAVRAQ